MWVGCVLFKYYSKNNKFLCKFVWNHSLSLHFISLQFWRFSTIFRVSFHVIVDLIFNTFRNGLTFALRARPLRWILFWQHQSRALHMQSVIKSLFLILCSLFGGCSRISSEQVHRTPRSEPITIAHVFADRGCVDLHATIQFSALTAGEVTNYQWDFGDGNRSSLPRPTHTYEQPGYYTVTLSVDGPEGSASSTVRDMIRVVDPRWQPLFSSFPERAIIDLWQNPSDPDQVYAISHSSILTFDGDHWQVAALSEMSQALRVVGSGGPSDHALILGTDLDERPVVVIDDQGDTIDLDPDGFLPHSRETEYINAFGTLSGQVVLIAQDPSEGISVWSVPSVSDPDWTELEFEGDIRPEVIQDSYIIEQDSDVFVFLLSNDSIFQSTSLNSDALYWTEHHFYPADASKIIAVNESTLWLSGNHTELYRGIWNDEINAYSWVDFSLLLPEFSTIQNWTLNADNSSLFMTLTNSDSRIQQTLIAQIENAASDEPNLSFINTNDADFYSHIEHAELAVYDENHIFYGSNNGYIAFWDGYEWELTTETRTTGDLALPIISPEGTLFVSTQWSQLNQLLTFSGSEVSALTMPEQFSSAPTATWEAEGEGTWIFNADGQVSFLDESGMRIEELPGEPGVPLRAWGASPDDIWAVGHINSRAYVLRYDGRRWQRDPQSEDFFGAFLWDIRGTDEENVYAINDFGIFGHFDGSSWSMVDHDIFEYPEAFGQCIDNSNLASCSATGYGFAPQHLTISPDGTLFMRVNPGRYLPVSGADSNCDYGQSRCVFESSNIENSREYLFKYSPFDGWAEIPWPQHHSNSVKIHSLFAMHHDLLYATTYTNVSENGRTQLNSELLIWDGASWLSMDEQPNHTFNTIFANDSGDLYTIDASNHLQHRQSCFF